LENSAHRKNTALNSDPSYHRTIQKKKAGLYFDALRLIKSSALNIEIEARRTSGKQNVILENLLRNDGNKNMIKVPEKKSESK